MTAAFSLEETCQQLDSLALTYLAKMNEYTLERHAVAKELEKGFLDLAHAKYTMGAKTISHLSYDQRMKAHLQVNTQQKDDHAPFVIHRPDQNTATALRQRKTKQKDWIQEPTQDDDQQEYEMDEKKKKRANSDPLHWFGLLVSPSLRTSQQCFKNALPHIVGLANQVHELQLLEQQYQSLVEKKDQAMESE